MKKRILWLALGSLIVLSLVLVSCGKTAPAAVKTVQTRATTKASAPTAQPQYGGAFKIGDFRLSSVLGNPATMNMGFSLRQAAPAIETLLRMDKSGQPIPWLAKSWATDPVAMTITLTLNTGIKFSDGTPFNAAAVKWNLDADTAAKQTGTTLIKSVDAVDDSTVRINLSKWDNTVLGNLAYSYLGAIISPTTAQQHDTTWINDNPVGTGPFVFKDWIPQVDISYTKNPNYWRAGEPYVDSVQNVLIADQTVNMLNFKAGQTDQFVDPPAADLPSLVKTYPNTVIEPFAAFATPRSGLIFDSANPQSPFADVRVRQAFQYAIDANAMNASVLSGLGVVTNQFVVPGNWGYDPTIVGYPYNPDKAKQLLSEAGIAPDQIKYSYYYNSGEPYDSNAAAVQGYEKAIGIDLTLVPEIQTTLTAQQSKDSGLLGAITATPFPDPVASFVTKFIGGDSRYWQSMLVPADYKQAVMSAVTAPDFATEQKDIQAADKLFTDKYCLAATWEVQPDACVDQAWTHGDGLYTVANDNWWSPESAWKDPGH